MKEKLVIENFGPIKKVDLDLKRINVFIGPNACGKSTISKIIAMVKSAGLYRNVLNHKPEFKNMKEILNISNYFNENSEISYKNNFYEVIENRRGEFVKLNNNERLSKINSINDALQVFTKEYNFYRTRFIPTERTFISTISNSLMGLIHNEVNLPKYVTSFGAEYEKARNFKNKYNIDFINISYNNENNNDYITFNDEEKLLLSESASGFQSLVPLYITIEYFREDFFKNHFIIEEPELNLFPNTQKGLVNFLIENTYSNENSLTINTHSPYILMALNNLIEANNTLKELKEKGLSSEELNEYETKIKKIVKSNELISFDDIAVYYIHSDGTAEDIKDYENRLINAEKIDSVSDIFADEVDALLEISYGK